ncbi:predicted transcriptional regulator [Anaerolinea thermolimosa]|uniref:helix-turn-helix transcriptional regulator n=1 Tax=Anaerolinea thermolimosa TaxID=229919 RepID=UPI0009FEE850|nr:helix-turn-helix domain-containing protein [Anaerolinea thermolimosa]GAP06611.1 predicted transcriptional regulator [Anaerolinea thermolimosa]
MSSESTRRAILSYLENHSSVSSREIARQFQITEAGARYHLGQLRREGLVIESSPLTEETTRRGHRCKRYSLSWSLRPHNLTWLTNGLWEFLIKNSQINEKDLINYLALFFGSNLQKLKNNAHKNNRLVELLNQHHYKASWEARREGPRFFFRNCPYSVIWKAHPVLCEMDRYILEQTLQFTILKISTIFPQTSDNPICIFQALMSEPKPIDK